MANGLFITLEGIEGVGKTTQLDYIVTLLKDNKHTVLVTREPGGTATGEAIRDILLHSKDLHIADNAELLLMFAARAQHLEEVIRPALERGEIVLCDRFTDATYAYQGGGRGIDKTIIQSLEGLVQQGLKPDITLLLDTDVETGLSRANKRSEADRFESETVNFFEKVRAYYHAISKSEPERVQLIDASQSIELVQKEIKKIFKEKGLC